MTLAKRKDPPTIQQALCTKSEKTPTGSSKFDATFPRPASAASAKLAIKDINATMIRKGMSLNTEFPVWLMTCLL